MEGEGGGERVRGVWGCCVGGGGFCFARDSFERALRRDLVEVEVVVGGGVDDVDDSEDEPEVEEKMLRRLVVLSMEL